MAQRLAYGSLGPISVNDAAPTSAMAFGAYINSGTAPPIDDGVVEAATATDTVISLTDFTAAVSESASAADIVEIVGDWGGTVTEVASAADTVSVAGALSASVSESAAAADTTSAIAVYNVAVAEACAAVDEVSARKYILTWFLSFADVTPPPQFQGPGNPGKLKGDFRLEEEE